MKKAEAETVIRHLCHIWRTATGQDDVPATSLRCASFIRWLRDGPHAGYLSFRSSVSVEYDVELWFDQEFRLVWTR